MKTPCKNCLVSPTCTQICDDSNKFWDEILRILYKYERFIYTKNKRKRKYIPEDKRKHWNRLITLHNEHVTYLNKRFYRLYPGWYEYE